MIQFFLASNGGCDTILPDLYAGLRDASQGCKQLDPNKLNSLDAILTLLRNVVQIALSLGALTAIGIIIAAAFMYITSNGDAPKIKKAKDTLINWLVGLIIIISAYAIVGLVAGGVH